MKNKIIVRNNLRLGDFIKTDLKYDEDLLLSNDDKVKEFLNKYSKFLNSCEEKDIEEFFKLTGLYMTHEYIETNEYKNIYFTLNGPYTSCYEYKNSKIKAYNHHLIVVTYVDSLEVFKLSITANKETIYTFKDKEEINVDEHKWNLSTFNDLSRKINYLKEHNYTLPNQSDINSILLDPFNNVLTLTNKGDLYINEYLYSKNVIYMFELNDTDIKLIYNDMIVEEYSSSCDGLLCKKYDKILFDENYMATLCDNVLLIYLILELGYNKSIYLRFMEVDDIECNKDGDYSLIIKKNKEKIRFPLYSAMLLS